MDNTANGGENTGKTFTQEEVNQIVSNRLKEEREKLKKEQDAAFADREKAINAREMRMTVAEELHKKGLPSSLVDAINCTDKDTMNKSIEILMQTYKSNVQEPQRTPYVPQNGAETHSDPVRGAMGL